MLGQRDDTPRRAVPVQHARYRALGVDQHQLGRSATDVEDQRRIVARLDQHVAAEHRQPRFFLGRDDVEMDARLVQRAGDEIRPVRRAPARLGGDGARQGDVAALQFLGADLERGQRSLDRRVAQSPGRRQPFAKPHDPRECIDHREPVRLRPRDQQPAIVGAEVQRGEMRRGRPAATRTVVRSASRRSPVDPRNPVGCRNPLGRRACLCLAGNRRRTGRGSAGRSWPGRHSGRPIPHAVHTHNSVLPSRGRKARPVWCLNA